MLDQDMAGKGNLASTHDPSARRDSGITRSSVRGSTAMPAVDVSGTIGGRDMVQLGTKWRDAEASSGTKASVGVRGFARHCMDDNGVITLMASSS